MSSVLVAAPTASAPKAPSYTSQQRPGEHRRLKTACLAGLTFSYRWALRCRTCGGATPDPDCPPHGQSPGIDQALHATAGVPFGSFPRSGFNFLRLQCQAVRAMRLANPSAPVRPWLDYKSYGDRDWYDATTGRRRLARLRCSQRWRCAAGTRCRPGRPITTKSASSTSSSAASTRSTTL